jgi:uncharacterized protein YceK
MKRKTALLSSLLLSLMLMTNGCVSIIATIQRPHPYAGTQCTLAYFFAPVCGPSYWATSVFLALNFPFTFIMDTLLLPVSCIIYADMEMTK